MVEHVKEWNHPDAMSAEHLAWNLEGKSAGTEEV
jgi:hypothetical protein